MSSTLIPREKLSAYQRWEMNSFESGAKSEAGPAGSARTDPRARRDGYEAGYRAGMAAAKSDAARTTSTQTSRLNEIIAALNRDVAALDAQIADNVLDLALIIAKKMAGEALNARPEMILTVVREALQLLGQARTPARLLLHPGDARIIRDHMGEQCAAGGWTIDEDASITPGGCRLESAGGELDASLSTRWQRLLAAFGRTGDWLE